MIWLVWRENGDILNFPARGRPTLPHHPQKRGRESFPIVHDETAAEKTGQAS